MLCPFSRDSLSLWACSHLGGVCVCVCVSESLPFTSYFLNSQKAALKPRLSMAIDNTNQAEQIVKWENSQKRKKINKLINVAIASRYVYHRNLTHFGMVLDYLSPPLSHALLIRGTMEKWPFQHYNMPHSFSAVQQATCSARAGQLTEHFTAALSSDALKSARNLRLHFICFRCEKPSSSITSDNLTYMSRLRRHVKLHICSGPCQGKEKCPLWQLQSRHEV